MANQRGAFDTPSGELEAIRSGGILGLVDDVLTTGATLDACGRAILRLRPDLELVAVVATIALRDVDPGGTDPGVA
jgi:predicted amidophosphoribosyltransferase